MDNVRRVKKQQKKERNGRQGSTYQTQIKHDTHVIGPSWTLISVGKIVQREESRQSKDFKVEK